MQYTSEIIQNLKSEGRLAARLVAEQGLVEDLSRDNLVVHVGKPVGSITGWLGPLFWQVWLEPGLPAGQVYARVESGEKAEWQFEAALAKDQLLAAAKDRMIANVKKLRETRLRDAQARVAQLEGAAA